MSKAIFIDSKNKTVSEVEHKNTDIDDIEDAVGGIFTMGHSWDSGETLYVNDEGLINGTKEFFRIEGGHQDYAGNGMIIGEEIIDAKGDMTGTKDVIASAKSIRKTVTFLP